MLKVIWNYEAAPRLRERLQALKTHGLHVEICPESDDPRLFDLLQDADVLWHCLRPVDAGLLAQAPRLRLVQKIGVGVNTIDLDEAKRRGIAVCNMPGSNSRAVAEHTLALMLAVLRQVPRFDKDVRTGQGWSWDPGRQDDLGEIGGRTVGLVGFGAVPTLLTPVLQALGAHVLYTARSEHTGATAERCSFDELLRRSHIVSLHVPLNNSTARMIDRGAFARMRPGSILINTARGGLVDERALLEALESGHLGGAGLDVFAEEPLPLPHPLTQIKNVVIAPHVAWLTGETLVRSLDIAVDNCHRLKSGEDLRFRVV
ncbi:MAG: 2-hydroxyacid dehydrogenase [Pseudomonadales bacterium]